MNISHFLLENIKIKIELWGDQVQESVMRMACIVHVGR
jgi:hypothetical protein